MYYNKYLKYKYKYLYLQAGGIHHSSLDTLPPLAETKITEIGLACKYKNNTKILNYSLEILLNILKKCKIIENRFNGQKRINIDIDNISSKAEPTKIEYESNKYITKPGLNREIIEGLYQMIEPNTE
jgi:hypothetical protein